jgi:hypothetical protein
MRPVVYRPANRARAYGIAWAAALVSAATFLTLRGHGKGAEIAGFWIAGFVGGQLGERSADRRWPVVGEGVVNLPRACVERRTMTALGMMLSSAAPLIIIALGSFQWRLACVGGGWEVMLASLFFRGWWTGRDWRRDHPGLVLARRIRRYRPYDRETREFVWARFE